MVYRVLVIALLLACGGKQNSEQAQAIEHYMNVAMQRHWAELWTAKRPFKTLHADAIDNPDLHAWIKGAMDDRVIPPLTAFLDGAGKIAPPAPMAASHEKAIEVATEYRAIAQEMSAAVDAKDAAKFKAAHARLMENTARYLRWQEGFDAVLDEYGAKMTEVPELPSKPGEAGAAP